MFYTLSLFITTLFSFFFAVAFNKNPQVLLTFINANPLNFICNKTRKHLLQHLEQCRNCYFL